ncbi:fasciclin-like arabinogalactan protein 12 [Punica granatum]|uniref:Uncharacterized protein n=3 Tax=Punica granatum TaxID=22663 RepID=A0A2I0J7F3_PUNGR|nr:fasciclin-like arabinogalactan protein 12 [Punica granatum]PKI51983.1 hypothetical protein CRG98_027635 [Punica granatum]
MNRFVSFSFSCLAALLLISFAEPLSAQSVSAPAQAPYQSPPMPPVQSPPLSPAAAPAPSSALTINSILQKYGYFTALLRLLKITGMDNQINSQIKHGSGLTFFAPTDNAFSKLKSGTLNSFNDQQQVELMQFHVIPTFLPMTQFQTVSNPLLTLADGANDGKFPLNVSVTGNSTINLSTGIDAATVENTLYFNAGRQLVVYQVDRVLLPRKIFMPNPPPPAVAPALAPATPKTVEQQEQPITESKPSSAPMARLGAQGVVWAGAAAIALFFS